MARRSAAAATATSAGPTLFELAARDDDVRSDRPPRPKGSTWTDEQWAGITTVDKSVLVSAAAGSGKTSVLAERCAYVVCDAPTPCDVDEMLVVTFTEAAAAEMKSRIETSLRARVGKSETPRLRRQLALIERANVSTLHGFCARLIRRHFHLLDLDPSFIVIDADEAKLLRLEVTREMFADRYEDAETAETFQQFVDAYADGNDDRLVKQVIGAHELLSSLVDPGQWVAESRERIASACEGKLEESAAGKELVGIIGRKIAGLRQRCDAALATVGSMGFTKYTQLLLKCKAEILEWEAGLKDGLDSLAEEMEQRQYRLPPISNDTPGKDVAVIAVDSVRKELTKGPLREMMRFSAAQWQDGVQRMLPHAEIFLELVEDFGRRYAREKALLRGVDFSDLERLALQALCDPSKKELAPSNIARALHKQFRYVLVDEYQDINEVQDAILRLVSRECVSGSTDQEQNLFCVGDVKQSIYRFRLAEPKRFLDRHARFKSGRDGARGQVIDLQANFRSRGPLLDALNDLFAKLMTREAAEIEYDETQKLRAKAKYPPGGSHRCFAGSPVELHLLPTEIDADDHHENDDENADNADESSDDDGIDEPDRTAREAQLIARQITAMTDPANPMCVMDRGDAGGAMTPRKILYRDIVILLRATKFKADDYAEVLRRSGIPVHLDSATGFFESMEVRDILALLKVLDNRRQDVPLAAVLRSPLAAIPDPEDALAQIRLAYRARRADSFLPFHQAVIRYPRDHDDELAAKLRDLLRQLDRWRDMAQRRPLAELIWDIYDTTGYLAFCAGLADGDQRTANLIDLHERARQFGTFQRQGLARFLEFLENLSDESDLGQPAVISEAEDAVRIMSIHHSKGLEFPVVIVPDLGKKINMQDCSGSILFDREAHLGMDVVDEEKQVRYPSLASTLVRERIRQQTLAEELRVLYVATTRAKEHLILIGTCGDKKLDGWKSRWSGFDGRALPADTVLGASTMLDWVAPAAVALDRGDGREPIRIILHDAAEVASWPTPESQRPKETPRLKDLARLAPLSPQPQRDEQAERIIDRLTAPYRFAKFTRLAAVDSATAESKRVREAQFASSATTSATTPRRGGPEQRILLEPPRSVHTELKPTAADVGSATHLVLQHVDFERGCDVSDLRRQLQLLVERRLISQNDAGMVDVDAICWLAGSEIGRMMRDHAKLLRRELPLYFARPPGEYAEGEPSDDPADAVMVRSRLDVLVPTTRGLEIIDYKTDKVSIDQVDARAEEYRPQMQLYVRAVEAMTAMKVAAVHLVFLSAKTIRTMHTSASA